MPNPPCGTTLYHSIKLHKNQSCVGSPGYIVGRSGITINLNGFTLSNGDNDYNGIDDTAGYNHVTVTNGSVTGFDEGVYYVGTKNATINNVDANSNGYGIDVEDSTNGTVSDSTADNGFDDGVFLYQNHNVTVSNTDASSNSLDGVYEYGSLDTIDGLTMNTNGGDGLYDDYPLTSNGLYDTIEHSSANDNTGAGVYIDDNTPTTLYQAKVFRNTATFNGDFGFYAYQKVKGFRNGVRGNAPGNCHNVSCYSIGP